MHYYTIFIFSRAGLHYWVVFLEKKYKKDNDKCALLDDLVFETSPRGVVPNAPVSLCILSSFFEFNVLLQDKQCRDFSVKESRTNCARGYTRPWEAGAWLKSGAMMARAFELLFSTQQRPMLECVRYTMLDGYGYVPCGDATSAIRGLGYGVAGETGKLT